ncbi:MAG: HDIG domain-containing protein [Bacteroidetes bacterium]|nr:HDIG domain-containing protein [Bacteroidota bacterium]
MTIPDQGIDSIVDEVISLYERFGGEDYIGEPVSQIEHMCQCAQLAEKEGYDTEVILAAFFHDIGHLCEHITEVELMDGYGVVDHEKLGADYLQKKGFSEKIAKLVASHVAAKRYLTRRYPDYYEQLSPASKETLVFQGGVMTEEEAITFESDPLAELYIRLRRWDEQAKQEHIPLPSLAHYRALMQQHLTEQSKTIENR